MKPFLASSKDSKEFSSLLEQFMNEFIFKLAISAQEKERIYRLRYDIYCEELGYEEPRDPSKKLEWDIHDQNSIHCFIEHRRTGLIAGCVRLVIPNPSSPPPLNQLPLQSYGYQSLTHPTLHPDHLPPESYYEISRLAVNRIFRSKIQDNDVPGVSGNPAVFTPQEKQIFPLLVSGLFLAGYALGRMTGKIQVFAMMEPRLPRLLAMSGFHFTKVGETIDFHGRRSAYYIDSQQAEKGMHAALMPLYLHIRHELSPQLKDLSMTEASVYCS
ncbi:PEP-CTERM/exosortase system-associated acyltransferase [Halomonas denitrificans]|uniref:PEP-CTERM/exosortase system-associated acyltransferase n=1 Tax=Halomonas denitrificans TaxID=370769 RepID=UPI000D3424B5|nr:PEP-CTERM/exosortase system-associated acyltransferase [Halomonas denitrificans]